MFEVYRTKTMINFIRDFFIQIFFFKFELHLIADLSMKGEAANRNNSNDNRFGKHNSQQSMSSVKRKSQSKNRSMKCL